MRVTGVPKVDPRRDGTRAASSASSAASSARRPSSTATDEIIYRFPEASEPSINQAACGQTARAVEARPARSYRALRGQTVRCHRRRTSLSHAADYGEDRRPGARSPGQPRRRHRAQHRLLPERDRPDRRFPGSVGTTFTGPAVDDTVFAMPAAGNYFFRCDVHPTIPMTGTFTVNCLRPHSPSASWRFR